MLTLVKWKPQQNFPNSVLRDTTFSKCDKKKNRGECGNSFKVTGAKDQGQFGHLQMELVSPLWPLNSQLKLVYSIFRSSREFQVP